jgi:hypothetical protein
MIYRRGKHGTYWLRFRFAGRFVHESTRTTSKTLAREAERQRRRELAEKFNGVPKRTLPPTISQASKFWIEKRVGLAAGTRETYQAALAHVRARFRTMLACEITARDIAEYQRARLAESAAGATINKEIACISSILSDQGCWERIRRDVKRLPENEEAGRALEPAEERDTKFEKNLPQCGMPGGDRRHQESTRGASFPRSPPLHDHQAFGTGYAVRSRGTDPWVVSQYCGEDGQALRSYPP